MANEMLDYAFMIGEFGDWTGGIDEDIRIEIKTQVRGRLQAEFGAVDSWVRKGHEMTGMGEMHGVDVHDQGHLDAIEEFLELANDGREAHDRFMIDPHSGLIAKCCKFYDGKWRSCERHPLLIGPDLDGSKHWSVPGTVGSVTRRVPIYLEVSWTCEIVDEPQDQASGSDRILHPHDGASRGSRSNGRAATRKKTASKKRRAKAR